MRTASKLTLLRHYAEGEDIEAADVAIERMATEDELKAVWRDPARWSYVVRDPTGAIAGDGAYDTLQECLDHALDSCALVTWERSYHPKGKDILDRGPNGKDILDRGWRFLLWPPRARRQEEERIPK